jgi:hypothetical protein
MFSLVACAPSEWRMVGAMSTPRFGHTATLLPDGTLLVTGGIDGIQPGSSILSTAERYDPVARTWSPAGTISTPRARHTATLLDDGSVLVVGGITASVHPTPMTSAVERFDPATGAWTMKAPTHLPRAFHMAVKLRDGSVLVIGGGPTGSVENQRSVERYDPARDLWLPVASTIATHSRGAATILEDGTVLVAGGVEYSSEADNPREAVVPYSERFDIATGHWFELASVSASSHTTTLLNDGTVLLSGGRLFSETLKRARRYNLAFFEPGAFVQLNLWQVTDDLLEARSNHQANLLSYGDVLVTGGYDGCSPVLQGCSRSLRSVEQYHPNVGRRALATRRLGCRSERSDAGATPREAWYLRGQ